MKKQNKEKQNQNIPILQNQKDQTVFVSGLPYSSTTDTIKQFFQGMGTIIDIKLPRYQDSGKIIGWAHVTFSNKDEAKQALKKNKDIIEDRYIDVQPAKGEQNKQPQYLQNNEIDLSECKTLFVKNLPYNITEDQVGDEFKKYGDIETIRFAYHSQQQHFKGFCYIDFKFAESAKKALQMNGQQFQGRTLYLDLDFNAPKKGYRYKDTETNTKYNKEHLEILHKKIQKKDKIVRQKDKITNLSKKNLFKSKKNENIINDSD